MVAGVFASCELIPGIAGETALYLSQARVFRAGPRIRPSIAGYRNRKSLLTKNAFETLAVHRCDCRSSEPALDWCCSAKLRQQLVAEINALEAQLQRLEITGPGADSDREQSCRDMIRGRRQLFRQVCL
jgi:hypothetical protein